MYKFCTSLHKLIKPYSLIFIENKIKVMRFIGCFRLPWTTMD